MSAWTQDFNTYVSRTHKGQSFALSSPMWLVMLIYVLVLLNAVAWGGIGLYEAVTYIV